MEDNKNMEQMENPTISPEKSEDAAIEQKTDPAQPVVEKTASEPVVANKEVKTDSDKDKPESGSAGSKKVQQGIVTSNKAHKTISVLVERRLPHPIYKKYFKRSKKFLAHDPENTCNIGDFVRIIECRPISKRKTWELLDIIERKA